MSLLYYSATRKKVLPAEKMFPLVERLLDDPDFYVQRGAGWALRELGNVYPRKARRFLARHATRLSAIAFAAATEKLEPAEKEALKNARRAARGRRPSP